MAELKSTPIIQQCPTITAGGKTSVVLSGPVAHVSAKKRSVPRKAK